MIPGGLSSIWAAVLTTALALLRHLLSRLGAYHELSFENIGLRHQITLLQRQVRNFSTTTTVMMLPTYGAYMATKGAVEQFTRFLAKDLAPRGVTANVV